MFIDCNKPIRAVYFPHNYAADDRYTDPVQLHHCRLPRLRQSHGLEHAGAAERHEPPAAAAHGRPHHARLPAGSRHHAGHRHPAALRHAHYAAPAAQPRLRLPRGGQRQVGHVERCPPRKVRPPGEDKYCSTTTWACGGIDLAALISAKPQRRPFVWKPLPPPQTRAGTTGFFGQRGQRMCSAASPFVGPRCCPAGFGVALDRPSPTPPRGLLRHET